MPRKVVIKRKKEISHCRESFKIKVKYRKNRAKMVVPDTHTHDLSVYLLGIGTSIKNRKTTKEENDVICQLQLYIRI
jgi:hypothetical protein